jgi:hypothetical protein
LKYIDFIKFNSYLVIMTDAEKIQGANNSVKIQTDEVVNSINMETPATKANLEPSATVKFNLIPMNQIVTLACSLKMTVKEIKSQLALDLKMNPQHLQIIYEKNRIYYLFFNYFRLDKRF